MRTEWGRLMANISEENDEETPLQERLNSLATRIGQIGLGVAILVFCILVIRCIYGLFLAIGNFDCPTFSFVLWFPPVS
jgi:Ca2+-transporting ATPase